MSAPAKINLYFEVLKKRHDGFHEIETLMSAISLSDSLALTATEDAMISVNCRWADVDQTSPLPPSGENLVTKALLALQQESHGSLGAQVDLVKRIPLAAGLGGGSSDAAAALLAANVAWKLHWSTERLASIAAKLGSDIPFFLQSGAAICRGRGEIIEPVQGFPALHLVIVKPSAGLGTAEVYRHCQPAKATCSLKSLQNGLAGGDLRCLSGKLHNGLAPSALELCPAVGRTLQKLRNAGCIEVLMSGSGSSCVGICRSAANARCVAKRMLAQNLGRAYVCRTLCGATSSNRE
jgi:4-diphosphocytidyl-2-C-methyl-D-erythritol kinase